MTQKLRLDLPVLLPDVPDAPWPRLAPSADGAQERSR